MRDGLGAIALARRVRRRVCEAVQVQHGSGTGEGEQRHDQERQDGVLLVVLQRARNISLVDRLSTGEQAQAMSWMLHRPVVAP